MLSEKIAQRLKDTHKQLLNEGKLLPVEKLQGYYSTFRDRFGPDALGKLDGETLLTTMHGLSQANRNSLVYWLEFKNDEEFADVFGGVGGANALKYGIYPEKKSGTWMKRGASNKPLPISLDEAIEIARSHRQQLTQGVNLLKALPLRASDAEYEQLQQAMNMDVPDINDTMWGHKYFHLMAPDKLDDYHISHLQRFHLVKLLQEYIPADEEGRYIAAGRYIEIANELGMCINHLAGALNYFNASYHGYWVVLFSQSRGSVGWDIQRQSNFVALGWAKLGDLSEITYDTASKQRLENLMTDQYPGFQRNELQSIFNFVTQVHVRDTVIAFDPANRKVMGVGKVTGDYSYNGTSEAAHRFPVTWLDSDRDWTFPDEEKFDSVIKRLQSYRNQVEVERHSFDAPPLQATIEGKTVISIPQGSPIRLTGLSGQVQTILERKGQVILYGPPGTGKTYLAEMTACELAARQVYSRRFAELSPEQRQQVFGQSDSYVQICSFHPAYGYEDFLEGYRPQVLNDQMRFVRQDGIFKKLCELARRDMGHNYYLIIDEINRGDIPRIFGELLTVLEKDKRGKPILLPLSGDGFAVPQNIFVIGTMNTADRSIALLDTALRRRFGFVELLPDPSQLGSTIIEGIPLGAWLEELNKRILQYVGRDARNLQIGHAYLLEKGKPITDFSKFARVIREDIIPLLEEYCYEDFTALEQILGTGLVNKESQIIQQALFEIGHERDLIQALLEPTPDLMTLSSVTEAESQFGDSVEDDERPDSDDER